MSFVGLCKFIEEGVIFKSYIDGLKYELILECLMEIQWLLGLDIVMCFDECFVLLVDWDWIVEFMCLLMWWVECSKMVFGDCSGYVLFGIMQGGLEQDFCEESVKVLCEIVFDGYVIGGLVVGEGQEVMFDCLDYVLELLLKDKLCYLMGVGKFDDIVGVVKCGVDMMDCVLLSWFGCMGQVFICCGVVNIKNVCYVDDFWLLDEIVDFLVCNYLCVYLYYVFCSNEMIVGMLLMWYNLWYFQEIMGEMCVVIVVGCFDVWEDQFYIMWVMGDIDLF